MCIHEELSKNEDLYPAQVSKGVVSRASDGGGKKCESNGPNRGMGQESEIPGRWGAKKRGASLESNDRSAGGFPDATRLRCGDRPRAIDYMLMLLPGRDVEEKKKQKER